MAKLKDMSGEKHNRLIALYMCWREGSRRRPVYMCQCDCGKLHMARGENIKSGAVKSCGCLLKEPPPNKTHGLKNHLLYGVWQNIKNRCYNENMPCYERYGGRGIYVCEEWRNSFSFFYMWAMKNKWKRGLEVDRIDNDNGYSPENCRIVTRERNLSNKGTYVNSKTGYSGITPFHGGRFRSVVSIAGKIKHIGLFKDLASAVNARNEYIKKNGLKLNIQAVPSSGEQQD